MSADQAPRGPDPGWPVLFLVGPTAVGKTAVSLALAEAFGAEIVSLDSRQMLRGLDIGTAKPTPAERARVPHHLVDIAGPEEPLPLARVLALARAAIADCRDRGRRVLVVGGSGQYVRALREGWEVPAVPPDPALRAELLAYAEARGPAALHARLAAVDPASAAAIDPRNVRRVARALEIHAATGRPPAEVRARAEPPFQARLAGLTRAREVLFARADARLDAMLAAGLEAEVRALVAAGYGWELPGMHGVGYREWRDYLAGTIDKEAVVRLIRHNLRRLIRSQAAWFRRDDPGIDWFDPGEPGAPAAILAWAGAAFGVDGADSAGAARSGSPPGGYNPGNGDGKTD